MSKSENNHAFKLLSNELNAKGGKLRYDPISVNLYNNLSNEEKLIIQGNVLEKIKGTDERIPKFALEIMGKDVQEYITHEIQHGNRPPHWVISALGGLYEYTQDESIPNKMLNFFCNEQLPITTRRLAFSFLSKYDLSAEMHRKLLDLYPKTEDVALKARMKKILGLSNEE